MAATIDKNVLTIAKPIFSNGKPLGAIAVDITIDDLSKIMEQYKLGDSGYSVLIDNKGTITRSYLPAMIYYSHPHLCGSTSRLMSYIDITCAL